MDKDTQTLREENITWCPHCQAFELVAGFHRDDPFLSCGHILTIEDQITRDASMDHSEGQKAYQEALKSFRGRTLYFFRMVREDGLVTAIRNIDILWN